MNTTKAPQQATTNFGFTKTLLQELLDTGALEQTLNRYTGWSIFLRIGSMAKRARFRLTAISVTMGNTMEAPKTVLDLVERFDAHRDAYSSSREYNETGKDIA